MERYRFDSWKRPTPSSTPAECSDLERFLLFSDAVFAIAITLLVLDLKPSLSPTGEFVIAPVIPNLIGFGLSFYVVGRYWLAHHQLFEAVRTYDRRLLTANLAFLASIVFLPFPTSVVALGKPVSSTVIFYTLSVAAVGLLMVALGVAARRPALLRPGETRGGTIQAIASMSASPAVFLASAGVALFDARLALWFLLSLIPVSWAVDRLGRAWRQRVDARLSAVPISS